jgi:hypothetical protein
MGDPACWLEQVCFGCGQIHAHLDEDRRCRRCRDLPDRTTTRATDPR